MKADIGGGARVGGAGAEGIGRAGADGRFIGKEIKPEVGPLKAGAGVAGAEIEVEDEA